MNNNQNAGVPNLNPNQVEQLLKMAGSRLGVEPEELKRQLQSGQLPGGVDQNALSQYLGDPKKLEALLSSGAARQLLQGFLNKGK